MIRQARSSDEEQIRACAEQAFSPYVSRIGRKPAPMSADFGAQIAAGQIHVAVDSSDSLQGFITFMTIGRSIHLNSIAVLPSAAGQGIGRALIRFCEENGRTLGCESVDLYTNEKMIENLSIYPRLGFVEVGRRTEDGFSRVYFKKQL